MQAGRLPRMLLDRTAAIAGLPIVTLASFILTGTWTGEGNNPGAVIIIHVYLPDWHPRHAKTTRGVLVGPVCAVRWNLHMAIGCAAAKGLKGPVTHVSSNGIKTARSVGVVGVQGHREDERCGEYKGVSHTRRSLESRRP